MERDLDRLLVDFLGINKRMSQVINLQRGISRQRRAVARSADHWKQANHDSRRCATRIFCIRFGTRWRTLSARFFWSPTLT